MENWTNLQASDQAIVREELDLHHRVKESVRAAALARQQSKPIDGRHVLGLRDEARSASERDLPAIFQALYTQHSLASRTVDSPLPDLRSPYFGHLRLCEQGKRRDILIGHHTLVDSGTPDYLG